LRHQLPGPAACTLAGAVLHETRQRATPNGADGKPGADGRLDHADFQGQRALLGPPLHLFVRQREVPGHFGVLDGRTGGADVVRRLAATCRMHAPDGFKAKQRHDGGILAGAETACHGVAVQDEVLYGVYRSFHLGRS
jgi:hypothetical protein